MVGSVLMERMRFEDDFRNLESHFFSTSAVGGRAPSEAGSAAKLLDAFDLDKLSEMEVLVSCQGSDYTKKIYEPLREKGWSGYWIDAASALRMRDDAVLILDPVNRNVIDAALKAGKKSYIGGNCTVSLMLMAFGGLFRAGLVEWVSSMTYQAASGAGAKYMNELMAQMNTLGRIVEGSLSANLASALEIERLVTATQNSDALPRTEIGTALAGSLIPWIDSGMENGQTKEEWKGGAEGNKILGLEQPIPIDGICVRIGALRCHSQAVTIKLKRDIPLGDVENFIRSSNQWVEIVANTREATVQSLTPAAVSGKLKIAVGRIRKLMMGPEYLGAFTVGDQLLWGAAEPLRRMLDILANRPAQ